MSRSVACTLMLICVSFVILGAGCATQPPRPKPKRFDLKFTINEELRGGSIQVDIIGTSSGAHLPALESIALSQYWSPGNPLRRDVPKATLIFGRGSPKERVFAGSDPKWNAWLGAGAEVLVIMVDSPGTRSRRVVTIDEREWKDVPVLEFQIQASGVQLVTAKPTK